MQDCQDVLIPAIKKSRKRHEKIRLYYELNSRFPGAAWDDLDLGLEHASSCERVAIVTDIGWVRLTVKARSLPDTQQDTGVRECSGRRGARLDYCPPRISRRYGIFRTGHSVSAAPANEAIFPACCVRAFTTPCAEAARICAELN